MNFDSKTVKKILFIVFCSAIIFAGVLNIGNVWRFLGKIVALFSPIIAALCIAFVLNVLLTALETKVFKSMKTSKKKFVRNMHRPLCLVLTYLIAFGLLAAAILVIIPKVFDTVSTIADKLPTLIEDFKNFADGIFGKWNFKQKSIIGNNIDWNKVSNAIKKWAASYSSNIFGNAITLTTSVFSAIAGIIFSLAISIYVLAQKEKIGNFVKRLIDVTFKQKGKQVIYNVAEKTSFFFAKFIAGQLTEAVILGTLCFIGMLIFGFPNALIISIIVSITALVPVVGSIVGAGIGALLIVITNPIKAILFVLFIIVLQQLEGNLIYPKVVGKAVGLPGVIVVSAVLLGGNIGGIFGALISVPTSAVLYTLLKEYIVKKEKISTAEALLSAAENNNTED